jgi:hypothetical protein
MTKPNEQTFPTKDKPGLTKREYFASMAFPKIGLPADDDLARKNAEQWARDAVLLADALIAELNKEAKP